MLVIGPEAHSSRTATWWRLVARAARGLEVGLLVKRSVDKEQFFTSASLAAQCVGRVASRWPLADFDAIVEPSAGQGAFYDLLPADLRVGVDVEPRHPELIRADYLTWRAPHGDRRILTIGNPPFGQRGALAISFLEKACTYSDVVAFILPRSFNKYTFQNRLPPAFHLVDSFDCAGFLAVDGTELDIKAVFQIWERRGEPRAQIELPATHEDFEMRHAHLSRTSTEDLVALRRAFHFTMPQVGVNFEPRDVETVTKGSHWFIKANVPGVRARFERLDFGFLENMNVAHTSLSKRDIVAAYVTALDQERGPVGSTAIGRNREA